jgi:hypothetical protein
MSIVDPDLVVNIAPATALQYNVTSLGVVSIQGANPFGRVALDYTQPPVGATAQVTFDSTGWIGPGQAVLIDVGGTYSVQSVDSGSLATLINLGYQDNASPDTLILAGSQAHPTGLQGIVGPQGIQGITGLKGDKGDPALAMDTIQIDAGSTARFSVQLLQQTGGNPTNLNPDKVQTVEFIGKARQTDPDSAALWDKVSPHPDIQILNADSGLLWVRLNGNETQPLAGGSNPVCLIRTTSPEGVRVTPATFALLVN